MARIMKGILYDKLIDLDEEPGLPPGTVVTVKIESHLIPLEKRRRLILNTGGAWKNDNTVGPIFEKIMEGRLAIKGREVNFGDSA